MNRPADPGSSSAAKERAEQAAVLIRKMMALPNDPWSRRDMKAAGRKALDLLDDLQRDAVAAGRLPDPADGAIYIPTELTRFEVTPQTPHSSLCALNAAGHRGPCTCGAERVSKNAGSVSDNLSQAASDSSSDTFSVDSPWAKPPAILGAPVSAAVSPAESPGLDAMTEAEFWSLVEQARARVLTNDLDALELLIVDGLPPNEMQAAAWALVQRVRGLRSDLAKLARGEVLGDA